MKQKKNKAKNDDFYFDDCAICRGMKEADEKGKNLNSEELIKLFAIQNKKNKSLYSK